MPVSPRLAVLRRLLVVLTAVLAAGVLIVVRVLGGGPDVLRFGLPAVLAGALTSWPLVARNAASWRYAERDDDLLVRRGVAFLRCEVVPYGRMQLVDVTAGPLQRRIGIATVHLHTAAPDTRARIPGLVPAEAARLRDRLTTQGQAQASGL